MGVLPLYMIPLLITEGTSENRKSCLLELYYMYMSPCLTEKLWYEYKGICDIHSKISY